MASVKRSENESFDQYKLRRSNIEFETKHKLKGKLVWNSAKNGTYKKSEHGSI